MMCKVVVYDEASIDMLDDKDRQRCLTPKCKYIDDSDEYNIICKHYGKFHLGTPKDANCSHGG